ncbi:hypothetical protein AB2D15_33880 [Pseudomonas aeruginosa]
MNYSDIVILECRRGLAALKAARNEGVKFNAALKAVERRLKALRAEAEAGEVIVQAEAAEAVNLADSVAGHIESAANGRVFAFFERVAERVGSLAAAKMVFIGIGLSFLTFAVRMHADLGSQLLNQVLPAILGMVLLIAYSFACAGIIVANRKPSLIREFVASVFALMPVFAAIILWDRAQDVDSIARGIAVEARLISPFFLSGLIVLLFDFVLPTNKVDADQSGAYVDDDFFSETKSSSHLSDPNYSSDLGYVSDATEI